MIDLAQKLGRNVQYMCQWEENVRECKETCWLNPKLSNFESIKKSLPISEEDVADASRRLKRFAPLIMRLFPETVITGGIIESPLREIASMKDSITMENEGIEIPGTLFLKCDSHYSGRHGKRKCGCLFSIGRF